MTLWATVYLSIGQMGDSQRKDRPLHQSDGKQHRQIFMPHNSSCCGLNRVECGIRFENKNHSSTRYKADWDMIRFQ